MLVFGRDLKSEILTKDHVLIRTSIFSIRECPVVHLYLMLRINLYSFLISFSSSLNKFCKMFFFVRFCILFSDEGNIILLIK